MNIQIDFVFCGVIIFFAIFALKGCKIGLVKGVISIFALLITIVAVGLVSTMITSIINKKIASFVVAIVFFMILMLVNKVIKIIFTSIKFLSKLPIISWIDKMLGLCLGVGEAVLILWIGFFLLLMFGESSVAISMLELIKDNDILALLYDNNYVIKILSEIGKTH